MLGDHRAQRGVGDAGDRIGGERRGLVAFACIGGSFARGAQAATRSASASATAHDMAVAVYAASVQVHLFDGTYELFRAWFGAPPAQHDGREVGATRAFLRIARDACCAAARSRTAASRSIT